MNLYVGWEMNSKQRQFTDSTFYFVPSLLTFMTLLYLWKILQPGIHKWLGPCQSFLSLHAALCKHTAFQITRDNLLRPIMVVPFSRHLCWIFVKSTHLFLALVNHGTIGCCDIGLLHCLPPRSLLFSTVPLVYGIFLHFSLNHLSPYPPLAVMVLVLPHTGKTTIDGAGG